MMALSDTAKTLLQNNPEAFLEAYGVHYVQDIVYGGSFIGSYHMAAKQQSDSSSLDVFAAASYSSMFFSASASAEFNEAASDAQGSVETHHGFTWDGGPDIVDDVTDPLGMGDKFTEWQQGFDESTAKQLTMV